MSDTTSLPDQPVSPGTVRTAPISEPAWLKSAASSLMQSNAKPETPTPSVPRPIEEESESVEDAAESELMSRKAETPPPPLSTYSLLANEKALKDVQSPLVSPAPPDAPDAPDAPAAQAEPTTQAVSATTSTVKVEGMRELTEQISYLIQRVSRLEKLALNGGHDDVRSVRSVSEFPLDVLKSKTGKRYLPTSRSVFLTYFSHQKNATNRSA